MPSIRRPRAIAAIVLGLVVLAGCENKITDKSYEQITNGMSPAQVEKILGGSGTDDTSHAGVSISGAGVGSSAGATEKTTVWKGKDLTIQVIFKDGKVVSKSKIAN